MNDNGGSFANVFTSLNSVKNIFKDKLGTLNDCDYTDLSSCPYPGFNNFPTENTYWMAKPRLTLKDGAIAFFDLDSATCTNTGGASGTISVCAAILIDVNGWKQPNKIGYDVFGLWVQSSNIKPLGTNGDAYFNSCSDSSRNYGCSAKYLMNNY